MPYVVNRSTSTNPPIIIPDGTANVADTSLTLVGRNYPNYGQAFAQNFVYLLENFASPNAPTDAIQGQLWYDSAHAKLRYFDGLLWNPVNVAYVTTSAGRDASIPNPQYGDLAVLYDTAQIQVFTNSGPYGSWQSPSTALNAGSITSLNPENVTTQLSGLIPVVDFGGQIFNTTKLNFLGDVYPSLVQTGMIVLWPMAISTVPSGWLPCNGLSYPFSSYLNLYNVIGTTYGNPYPNYFSVPNLIGPTTGTNTLLYIIKT